MSASPIKSASTSIRRELRAQRRGPDHGGVLGWIQLVTVTCVLLSAIALVWTSRTVNPLRFQVSERVGWLRELRELRKGFSETQESGSETLSGAALAEAQLTVLELSEEIRGSSGSADRIPVAEAAALSHAIDTPGTPCARLLVLTNDLEREIRVETSQISSELDDQWLNLQFIILATLLLSGATVALVWHSLRDRRRISTLRQSLAQDELTGVLSRAGIFAFLEDELARPKTPDEKLGILFIDLDRFKTINDTFGHPVGDQVLTTVASRLADALRGSDGIGRFGGDEFLAVLPGCHRRLIGEVTARLKRAFELPVIEGEPRVLIGASVGAVVTGGLSTADEIIATADRMAYEAKSGGGGDVRVAELP